MNVIARTDPHACTEEYFRAHPDRVQRLAGGQPRRHWASPQLYVTCALGPHNFEFITEVTREIVTAYQVDGVFSNRWTGHGQCWCQHCRRNFRAFSGLELPSAGSTMRDPARRRYAEWHEHRLFELWRLWDAEIRKINPAACFIANSGGGAGSELDMRTIGGMAPILFADRQARRGLTPPWANGKNGKEYRATMGRKPIGGIVSVGVEEPARWKDSVQSEAELRIWFADGIAQGLRPWFTKFNAKPLDQRWLPVVESVYTWHWRNERYLRNEENLAETAIVYSQQSARYHGAGRAEAPTLGWYQALVESRIPFEMVHDRKLDTRFKLLILPNISALSDEQCRQLTAYVEQGGTLIATLETSLYDEQGEPRSDFGLTRLFGCSYSGRTATGVQNSYLTLEHPHPLLKGLEEAPRIINGTQWVHVRPHDKTKPPLTLVPGYPDLPMEMVYTTTPRTDIPAAFCRAFGKGKVIYFPMDLDRTFWDVLHADHLRLMRNAVQWCAPPPVRITGPGLLDIAVWRQQRSLALHLVNLTNPMTMKGPYREIFPAGPFHVEWDLPEGVTPKSALLLESGREASLELRGSTLTVEVPRVS
ncbi:MAG: beta-galactosidase trimerization domain-containing protein, partial [Acidobacteria bacterium]|nr:beta-galactosidase trimerization domain-containing protein [Acidobacteriota bacterium]